MNEYTFIFIWRMLVFHTVYGLTYPDCTRTDKVSLLTRVAAFTVR